MIIFWLYWRSCSGRLVVVMVVLLVVEFFFGSLDGENIADDDNPAG